MADESNYYFTEDTEKAILEYQAEQDEYRRNLIFNSRIYRPMLKLCECVLNSSKFPYINDPPNDVKADMVTFCVSKFHMFDPAKGKAYSFFSWIAKNHLINWNDNNYGRFKKLESINIFDTYNEYKYEYCSDGSYESYVYETDMDDKTSRILSFYSTDYSWLPNSGSFEDHKSVVDEVMDIMSKGDDMLQFKFKYDMVEYISEKTGLNKSKVNNTLQCFRKHYRKNRKIFEE